jgi:hypothetical protein
MALFFRDLGHGKVKVSFRSTGDVDVNRFARRFGGGGHAKAAGAMIAGTLEEVRETVVDAAREFVGAGREQRVSPDGGAGDNESAEQRPPGVSRAARVPRTAD